MDKNSILLLDSVSNETLADYVFRTTFLDWPGRFWTLYDNETWEQNTVFYMSRFVDRNTSESLVMKPFLLWLNGGRFDAPVFKPAVGQVFDVEFRVDYLGDQNWTGGIEVTSNVSVLVESSWDVPTITPITGGWFVAGDTLRFNGLFGSNLYSCRFLSVFSRNSTLTEPKPASSTSSVSCEVPSSMSIISQLTSVAVDVMESIGQPPVLKRVAGGPDIIRYGIPKNDPESFWKTYWWVPLVAGGLVGGATVCFCQKKKQREGYEKI